MTQTMESLRNDLHTMTMAHANVSRYLRESKIMASKSMANVVRLRRLLASRNQTIKKLRQKLDRMEGALILGRNP